MQAQSEAATMPPDTWQSIKEELHLKELNKAQVAALFEREAVLIGTADGVADFRASALFGKEAVEFVHKMTPGSYWNAYAAGGATIRYLTFLGFQAAASFHNVQALREEARA